MVQTTGENTNTSNAPPINTTANQHNIMSVSSLSPPEHLSDLSMEGYTKWKQRFQIYRIASRSNLQDEKVQVAILLHCMGEQCIDIYNTFKLADDKKDKYEDVVKAFDAYFVPIKNESLYSHLFFTRNQHSGETFDAYITELKKISKDCNFGELTDRLIRDRIVAGISDKKLQNRLLRETDLDLKKTERLCKAAELAEAQMKKMENSDSSEVAVIRKEKSSQKPYTKKNAESSKCAASQNKNSSSQRWQVASPTNRLGFQSSSNANTYRNTSSSYSVSNKVCSRCGLTHRYKNCPAYGKVCVNCNKMNHFKKMCKSTNIKQIDIEDALNKSFDDFEINYLKVDSIETQENWTKNVTFVDFDYKMETFKLDTGAQCNVIPVNLCKKLGVKQFEKSNLKLMNYEHKKIETLGKINLNCKIDNKEKNLRFEVYKGISAPIIGLPTIIKCKLLLNPKIENVQAEVKVINLKNVPEF